MATRAEAVELLINKGKFEPQVALAVAEAIAVTMTESQVVTVPVLDLRLAETAARLEKSIATTNQRTIERLEASIAETNRSTIDRLEQSIAATRGSLEQSIAATTSNLEQSIAATKGSLEQSIAEKTAGLAKSIAETHLTTIATLEKTIGVTNSNTKAELVRWVLLVVLGCVALQGATVAFFNAFLHR